MNSRNTNKGCRCIANLEGWGSKYVMVISPVVYLFTPKDSSWLMDKDRSAISFLIIMRV